MNRARDDSAYRKPEEPGAAGNPEAPRAYRAPISTLWWLRRRSYALFAMRELSSVFVAWSVVYVLLMVRAVSQGDADYQAFLDWAATPWVVALNVLTVAFLLLHAITWFNLTPAAMVVRLQGRPVPPAAIAGGAFASWLVVSVGILWWVVTR